MSSRPDTPNLIQRGIRLLMATRPVTWVLARTFHHIDAAAFRVSGGRTTAGAILSGLPLITLTTTGAKSGRPRTVTLVGIPDDDRLILIASNWGQEKHPAWYYNLKTHAEATLSHGGASQRCTARELRGAEREVAWARAVALYPGYQGYAHRTNGRSIPVLVLEPREV